uniref:AB hydrolase-1 domain-containing protein n=1 Tax=Leersia perrieri TaxID=77586 RepID=A0A0D9V810_9ORYZ
MDCSLLENAFLELSEYVIDQEFEMAVPSKLVLVIAVALLGWAYKAARPPPPTILGGPGGPPVASPRVQLKDGRHLAYREAGVDRGIAKYKIIFFHGFGNSKESDFPVSKELTQELGIYLLYFDRAGYGDSDANPNRGLKSDAMDVEELADKLQLGEKFYVVGTSMGGYVVWSCLNYIPQRLAGAALVVPVVNYWWPMPANVWESAYSKLDVGDQRTFWIAHHVPWLFYAWFNQKWFRISPIVDGKREAFTDKDWEILTAMSAEQLDRGKATKQGDYHSLCRDAMILFGTWEFDPMLIKNPFLNGEGVVSIWQGREDRIVRVEVQRYVAEKLPWVRYHEHPEGGHLFTFVDGRGDKVIRELLLGEQPKVGLLGWAYMAARQPPPVILGGPGGPPVTCPRVQLKDGRHLAYREAGVPKEIAKYKIIFFHGFASTKDSEFPVSQELAEELGIYLLYFDRAGYGDSDANPSRGLKSDATDVEELADGLQLGEKFYVVGTSMGGYVAWSCLNYIPHRLAGAALVVPAVNYWWPMPANVSESAYSKLDVRDQRSFWVAHHMPWLLHTWFKQKKFKISPIVEGKREAFTDQDWEILTENQRKEQETGQVDRDKATKQGAYHSLCRDVTILFGAWVFDPTMIKNPFPNGEGVVSIWQGREDKIVRVEVQRYVADKLPWVRYHEIPEGGHLFICANEVGDKIIRELLNGEEPQGLWRVDHIAQRGPGHGRPRGHLEGAWLEGCSETIVPPSEEIQEHPDPSSTNPHLSRERGKFNPQLSHLMQK